MHLRRLGLIVALLSGASSVGAAPAGFLSGRLANGLEVVAIEASGTGADTGAVTVSVWYRVGSADEAAGEEGVAHYLEHLLFWGSPANPHGPFAETLAAVGGAPDARTSFDFTGYWTRIAPGHVPVALAVEAERMHGFAFDRAVARRERREVAKERMEVVDAVPQALFDETRRAALFAGHPYGRPPIGWPEEIERLSLGAAEAFYRRHYGPDNAALVVVGDIAPVEVLRLAGDIFGRIPAGPARPPRSRPLLAPPRGGQVIEMRDPRVRQPASGRLFPAPVRRPGDQAAAAALVILDELLGGPVEASVLGRDLVTARGIAVDAGSSYLPAGVDRQAFGVFVAPRPGVSLEDAEAALDASVAAFLATGPDAADLARAKERAVGKLADPHGDPHGDSLAVARHWGVALATGLAPEDIRDWPSQLDAVTADDVRGAARAVLRPETSVLGRLIP